MCGEQEAGKGMKNVMEGSPPRVRGTAIHLALLDYYGRITPACAGNRLTHHLKTCFFEDHPRVCGEQSNILGKETCKRGSPPRVRGTVSAFL